MAKIDDDLALKFKNNSSLTSSFQIKSKDSFTSSFRHSLLNKNENDNYFKNDIKNQPVGDINIAGQNHEIHSPYARLIMKKIRSDFRQTNSIIKILEHPNIDKLPITAKRLKRNRNPSKSLYILNSFNFNILSLQKKKEFFNNLNKLNINNSNNTNNLKKVISTKKQNSIQKRNSENILNYSANIDSINNSKVKFTEYRNNLSNKFNLHYNLNSKTNLNINLNTHSSKDAKVNKKANDYFPLIRTRKSRKIDKISFLLTGNINPKYNELLNFSIGDYITKAIKFNSFSFSGKNSEEKSFNQKIVRFHENQ